MNEEKILKELKEYSLTVGYEGNPALEEHDLIKWYIRIKKLGPNLTPEQKLFAGKKLLEYCGSEEGLNAMIDNVYSWVKSLDMSVKIETILNMRPVPVDEGEIKIDEVIEEKLVKIIDEIKKG